MEEKFNWQKELDDAGRAAFRDLDCGGDGLKKSESAKVVQTLYTLHLADERKERELKIKEHEDARETAQLILDGCKTAGFFGLAGVGLVEACKNYHSLLALEDSWKVVSNRVFQWNTQQILKAAMSSAAHLIHF
ncbi:MAG: hypothetical protein J6U54_08525 [Clostridiales bacterium]|nr:hypothetical protein [Clostridiales bacterium]